MTRAAKLLAAAFLGALALSAAQPAPQTAASPRVTRANLAFLERSFDQRIEGLEPADPYMLLGNTRGIYLEGFGAVFTAEVNLVTTILTPFRPNLSAEDKIRIKQKKQLRLPAFKLQMRAALVSAGAALDGVPLDEQVVLGVSLFNSKLEDTSGLPGQIVMQAPRRALVAASRGNDQALEAVIKVQEY